MATSMNS